MDALIESAQGDMRVMLGQLQMHRVRATSLTFDEVRGAAAKDMDKSPFDCARRLLSSESAQWSMMDRMDAVFQDLDLVPLLIQVRPFTHPSCTSHQSRVCKYSARAKALDTLLQAAALLRYACHKEGFRSRRRERCARGAGELHKPPAQPCAERGHGDASHRQGRRRLLRRRPRQHAHPHRAGVAPRAARRRPLRRVPRRLHAVRRTPLPLPPIRSTALPEATAMQRGRIPHGSCGAGATARRSTPAR